MDSAEPGRGHPLRSPENTSEERGALKSTSPGDLLDRIPVFEQQGTGAAQALALNRLGDGFAVGVPEAAAEIVGVAPEGKGDVAGGQLGVEVLQDILSGEARQGRGAAAVGRGRRWARRLRQHQLDQEGPLVRVQVARLLIVHVVSEQGSQALRALDARVPGSVFAQG